MNAPTVPSDALYRELSPEQQAIVKMWLGIGLDVEISGNGTYWLPYRAVEHLGTEHPWPVWFYRLKP